MITFAIILFIAAITAIVILSCLCLRCKVATIAPAMSLLVLIAFCFSAGCWISSRQSVVIGNAEPIFEMDPIFESSNDTIFFENGKYFRIKQLTWDPINLYEREDITNQIDQFVSDYSERKDTAK